MYPPPPQNKKKLKPKQISNSNSCFLYLQLFHYALCTVMQIMTSYGINSKGKKKMEIDDSEVDDQHFYNLYIPSSP